MNKLAVIKYGAIICVMTATISAIAINSRPAEVGADEESGIIIADELDTYDLCNHDESYVEPELKIGKYYYNGDTSAKYIEITGDGYLYFRGGSPEEFVNDIYGDTPEALEKAKEADPDGVAEEIEFYSKPCKYRVYTEHILKDKIFVYERWSENDFGDGREHVSGGGMLLEDENTLMRNDFTRFIYIEE